MRNDTHLNNKEIFSIFDVDQTPSAGETMVRRSGNSRLAFFASPWRVTVGQGEGECFSNKQQAGRVSLPVLFSYDGMDGRFGA